MKNYYQLSREIAHLNSASALIHWDFETGMPPGATAWRAETMGHFAGMVHERRVSPEYLAAAEKALSEATDEIERHALKEAITDIKKITKVPQALVEKISQAQTLGHEAWVKAKKEKNFSLFAPALTEMLALMKEYSTLLADGGNGYDALLDEYSPGMNTQSITKLFQVLRPELIKLLSQRKPAFTREWSVPVEIQEKACEAAIEWMGFSKNHIIQKRSVHPFCTSLHPSDVRITTRFTENDPLMSILSTVHELGHGLYEHQLSEKYPGTPLAQAGGMDLHESQSRLWEVCLATSPEFYRWLHGWFSKNAPEHIKGLTAEDLFKLGSNVTPSLIRTEADPVSYGLHIMVRFEIECALFDGSLAVNDLPRAWNDAYEKYLGILPPDDGVGVLQDTHWSSGGFGYFPSYLLGTMIACQLHATLKTQFPDLSARVEKGDFAPVREWLKENVHRYGRGMAMPALMKKATGRELESAPFLEFLKKRFIA
jgi:carboxypeptidase Taq